jgi:peptidoglycan/LPS O-acetylase OafA/YrhL
MSERRLPHFAELDGIRGLAALAVFATHFFGIDSRNATCPICTVASFGYLGVQVFFVLSGFLITSLLFIDRRDPHMLRNFYWKRVLRIWPALLIFLGIIYLFAQFDQTAYIVMSLLFVSNFASLFGTTEFGGTWSLAIEEQFYLLWPQVQGQHRFSACDRGVHFFGELADGASAVAARHHLDALHAVSVRRIGAGSDARLSVVCAGATE